MRRAVVLLPNGFTLFNLFCGIYAIVLSSRGNFSLAATFIVLGGIADGLDGRVARATGTGSKFGEELDSLVDAISFGLAPALLMYFAVLNQASNWQWLLVFIFTSCAVMRLARFNVEQAGRKKTYFHGLPSPAAGLTLTTYYWFSQTELYSQTVILFTDGRTLADLPWQKLLSFLMAILAALMISNVPYPAFPAVGLKTNQQRMGTAVVLATVLGMLVFKKEFYFPAAVLYVTYGVVKYALFGVIGRSSSPDQIYWDGEGEKPAIVDAPPKPRPSRPAAPVLPPPPPADGVLYEDDGGVDRTSQRDERDRQRRRRRRRGGGGRGNRPDRGNDPSQFPEPPKEPDQ
jgi:CDP-diacylglycerol---serine O-phosphatidyltransferase